MSSQYIVFTLPTCQHCIILKERINHLVTRGMVRCVNLKEVASTSGEMKVFKMCSPEMNVPALAVISTGRLVNKAIGTQPIIDTLKLYGLK